MKGLSALKLFIFMAQFIWNPIMDQFNKNILRDEIKWLLEAINEQFEAINAYEDKIPQIEFDIIMENIRKLYQNLHILNRHADAYPHVHRAQSSMSPVNQVAPPVEEEDPQDTSEEDHQAASEEEIQPPLSEEQAVGQPLVKILVEPDVEAVVETTVDKEVQTEVEDAPKIEPVSGEKTMPGIDLFSTEMSEFSEKLKDIREKTYASERQASQRKELKASISINEKFLFINELFDGNLREYNATIEILNNFSDLREALEFLDSQRVKNLWESESPAFKRLTALVEGRY